MLKRLLCISVALLGTILAIPIYMVVFMPNFRIPGESPWPTLALGLVQLTIAMYLFTRWRSWPAFLLLIGSIPIVLLNISSCGFFWRIGHGASPRLALFFPSDQEDSPIKPILFYIDFLLLCLPLAFFWYFVRVADRHLTNR